MYTVGARGGMQASRVLGGGGGDNPSKQGRRLSNSAFYVHSVRVPNWKFFSDGMKPVESSKAVRGSCREESDSHDRVCHKAPSNHYAAECAYNSDIRIALAPGLDITAAQQGKSASRLEKILKYTSTFLLLCISMNKINPY